MACAVLVALVAGCSDGGSAADPEPTETTAAPRASVAPPAPVESKLVTAACRDQLKVTSSTVVRSPDVTEASGVVASRRSPGTYWVHNDSGDSPRFFGVAADGAVQTVDVTGADAVDWEDIAADATGGEHHLWLADIGDNESNRPEVVVYRVPEPGPGDVSVAAERLTLHYPDGAHNAEALMVDPADGSLVVVTKDPEGAGVYSVQPPVGGGERTLTAAAAGPPRLPPGGVVTGADVSADRSAIAVRTYGGVFLYGLDAGQSIAAALAQPPCRGPSGNEGQGEAVGVDLDGLGYVTIGEGASPPLTRVRLGG